MEKGMRDHYFDQLRGLAMILVVLGHTNSEAITCFEEQSFNFLFLFSLVPMLVFCNALFVFISGYFLSQKTITTLSDYTHFLKKHSTKILIPYLFYTTLLILSGIFLHHHYSTEEIISKYLTGSASAPYYFIILILQYYILLPLLQRINTARGLFLSCMVNAGFFAFIYYLRIYVYANMSPFYVAGVFPAFIFFFQTGLYAGTHSLTRVKKSIVILGIILAYLFSAAEAFTWLFKTHNINYATSQIRIFSLLFSVIVIYYLLNYRFGVKTWLLRIGEVSFGIYFIHMIVLYRINILLRHLPALMMMQPLYQVVDVALTISCSFGIIYLSKKIFPDTITMLLGFHQ
jgi:probable poly-beta-1,6-N-acetyl-D-glucosamine export protein